MLGISVLVPMMTCYLVGISAAAKLAGYVAAITVIDHGQGLWLYALYRCVETMLGVAVTRQLCSAPLPCS